MMPFSCLAEGRRLRADRLLERKKTIIDTSRRTALCRVLLHAIPICISLMLIALNLQRFFIGLSLGSSDGAWTTTFSLAVLQVAAKLQVSEACYAT